MEPNLTKGKLYQLTLQGVDSLSYFNIINGRYLGQIPNKNVFLFLKTMPNKYGTAEETTVLQCLFGETLCFISIKTSALAANVKKWECSE